MFKSMIGRLVVISVAGLTLVGVATAAESFRPTPSKQKAYSMCASKSHGHMRLVKINQPCRPHEHRYRWDFNTKAPVEVPSQNGEQDGQGANGKDGLNGTDGLNGKDGLPGLNGKDGLAGKDGKDGANGLDGAAGQQGPAGPAGVDGAAGQQGPAGPAGVDGADGEQGHKGEIGPQGPAGSKGDKGDAGEQGPQGKTGPAGAQGEQGPQGPAGPQGRAGTLEGADLITLCINTNGGSVKYLSDPGTNDCNGNHDLKVKVVTVP